MLGNFIDQTNETNAQARVYDGGGIAPTIGASNFGHERYVLIEQKKGLICCFAMDGSKQFGLKPQTGGYANA